MRTCISCDSAEYCKQCGLIARIAHAMHQATGCFARYAREMIDGRSYSYYNIEQKDFSRLPLFHRKSRPAGHSSSSALEGTFVSALQVPLVIAIAQAARIQFNPT